MKRSKVLTSLGVFFLATAAVIATKANKARFSGYYITSASAGCVSISRPDCTNNGSAKCTVVTSAVNHHTVYTATLGPLQDNKCTHTLKTSGIR